MKLSMFATNQQMLEHYVREIPALEKAVQTAEDSYNKAVTDISVRKNWCDMNNIALGNDEAWKHQLEWMRGNVNHQKRRLNKHLKKIAEIRAIVEAEAV